MDAPVRILIVDDEYEILDVLSKLFRRRGLLVQTASGGSEALERLQQNDFDVVLTDLAMPDMSGVELLKYLRASHIHVPLIVMTGVGSIESAVDAVRHGAYDYIRKPVKLQDLEELIQRAVAQGSLQKELEREAEEGHGLLPMLMGGSRAWRDILETVERISASAVPVLICGETGTGKSLLARHVHRSGSRANKPLMTINCGALPENLLESELFGHVRGAFTGATQDRRGLLEEAQGGTVFLDEVGEMPPAMQVKLLHAIQEKEIRPVGGNRSITVDVRYIAATNRDLAHEVEEGRFREDLYYRLAVIPLCLPPLRERMEDFSAFVGYFIKKFNQLHHKRITDVEPVAMDQLRRQVWRGNVRELEHALERAVLLARSDIIQAGDLGLERSSAPLPHLGPTISLQAAVEDAERRAIAQALVVTKGNRSRAAEILGIGRRTLYSKLDEYGI